MRKILILLLMPALLGSCNAISTLVHDDQVVAKVGKNKATKLQEATIEQIRKAGGIAEVVYSVDDVKQVISGLEELSYG